MDKFITDDDYSVVIGDQALKIISQVSPEIRARAEAQAMEEIASYLRPKYDAQKIFGRRGDERNSLIVMHVCDIALYHMAASLPGKMGIEIRKERYDRSIKWLEGVQASKIIPEIQTAADDITGEQLGGAFRYGSQPKLRHNW